MNIIIQSSNEIEDVKNVSNFIWKKYQKGYLIYVLVLAFLSIFLIYLGVTDGYDFQSSFDIHGNMNSRDCENYFYNFNLTLGFGISMFVFALLVLIVFIKQKNRFYKQYKSKVKKTDEYSERNITNEFYEFKSSLSTRKHQWKVFESYKKLDNFILLNTYKKSNFHIEFINLNKLNSEQKNELIQLLNKNNIEKE